MSKIARSKDSVSHHSQRTTPFFNRGNGRFFSVQQKQENNPSNDIQIMRQESETGNQDMVFDLGERNPALVLNARLASRLTHTEQMIVQTACNKMTEIRQVIQSGRVWEFEEEEILIGETEVLGDPTLLQQRNQTLSEVIAGLANIIDMIISGQLHVIETTWYHQYLASLFFETQTGTISYGHYAQSGEPERHPIMGNRFFPWMRGARLRQAIYEPHDYIRYFPLLGSVLSAGTVPWWTPVHEICTPSTAIAESETPHLSRRVTEYWIHLADPVHHPTIIDGLYRGSPPSSLYMRPPGDEGSTIERIGDSYPLMQEGIQYFYMQGERRIDLPNIRSEYPELR